MKCMMTMITMMMGVTKIIRTYTELLKIKTFKERFNYLKLSAMVGEDTFGHARYLNQELYRSKRWRSIRDEIIIRDDGCDLAIENRLINGQIVIHHMNPIGVEDIYHNNEDLIFNPEFLICTTPITHNAIHFGDERLLFEMPEERKPNDTTPWL